MQYCINFNIHSFVFFSGVNLAQTYFMFGNEFKVLFFSFWKEHFSCFQGIKNSHYLLMLLLLALMIFNCWVVKKKKQKRNPLLFPKYSNLKENLQGRLTRNLFQSNLYTSLWLLRIYHPLFIYLCFFLSVSFSMLKTYECKREKGRKYSSYIIFVYPFVLLSLISGWLILSHFC